MKWHHCQSPEEGKLLFLLCPLVPAPPRALHRLIEVVFARLLYQKDTLYFCVIHNISRENNINYRSILFCIKFQFWLRTFLMSLFLHITTLPLSPLPTQLHHWLHQSHLRLWFNFLDSCLNKWCHVVCCTLDQWEAAWPSSCILWTHSSSFTKYVFALWHMLIFCFLLGDPTNGP